MWNINNGERFIAYAIEAPPGSGIITLNGSAARRASVGDLVIIAAFGMVSDLEPGQFKPKLVFPDAQNRIVEVRSDAAGPQASKPDGLARRPAMLSGTASLRPAPKVPDSD